MVLRAAKPAAATTTTTTTKATTIDDGSGYRKYKYEYKHNNKQALCRSSAASVAVVIARCSNATLPASS